MRGQSSSVDALFSRNDGRHRAVNYLSGVSNCEQASEGKFESLA